MPSTATYKRGHVIVVNVPFSNHTGAKPRPALVISADIFHHDLPDLIVCPISSQPRYHQSPGAGDCPLQKWRAVGLRHPSTARISKILAVDKKIRKRVLGLLPPQDLNQVEKSLRKALDLR
jgi:mRNA-degrading endonuclease toxin of MazEF toxin-antitoxin module